MPTKKIYQQHQWKDAVLSYYQYWRGGGLPSSWIKKKLVRNCATWYFLLCKLLISSTPNLSYVLLCFQNCTVNCFQLHSSPPPVAHNAWNPVCLWVTLAYVVRMCLGHYAQTFWLCSRSHGSCHGCYCMLHTCTSIFWIAFSTCHHCWTLHAQSNTTGFQPLCPTSCWNQLQKIIP